MPMTIDDLTRHRCSFLIELMAPSLHVVLARRHHLARQFLNLSFNIHTRCRSFHAGFDGMSRVKAIQLQPSGAITLHGEKEIKWHYFSSEATPTTTSNTEKCVDKYLSREMLPLGSLDMKAASDVVAKIQALTSMPQEAPPNNVKTALDLLERLCEGAKFNEDKQLTHETSRAWGDFVIPKNLIHDVVNAWRGCISQTTTPSTNGLVVLSPRNLFELVKRCISTFPALQHDHVPFNMILNGASAFRDLALADEILNQLLEWKKNGIQMRIANTVTFNSVIDAWAKSGRPDAAQKAEAVLQTMIEYSNAGWKEVTPNVVSYNSVIQAWANSNLDDAPRRAEELLYQLQDCGLKPNKVSYSSVQTAWPLGNINEAPAGAKAILKRKHKLNQDDARQAKSILVERCERYDSTRDRDDLPDVSSFAAAESGRPDAPKMEEQILEQMENLAVSCKEPSPMPDVGTFNSVLKAWSRSRDPDAPIRCEQILERMQQLLDLGQADSQPNVVSFSTVIDCWAKSSRPEAPERAESILRQMFRLWESGNHSAKPNVVSFSSVMNAWAKSRRSDAATRAQALFDELLKRYIAGDQDMKPNTRTFGTLVNAWATVANPDGAAKAQAVFDNMVMLYRIGDHELKPDVAQYSALINAWAEAGLPEKAERILVEMESEESIGNVKPDIFCYTSVMKAWANSRKPEAAERAQALFDVLVQKYRAGHEGLKPDLRTYATLITAWGRSKRKDSATRAQAVFDELVAQCNSGDREMKVTVVQCSALIDAWAKAGEPERAEQILRDINSGTYVGVKANCISYTSVMNCWANSRHPQAAERIRVLYGEMMQKYLAGDRFLKPDQYVINILRRFGIAHESPDADYGKRSHDRRVGCHRQGLQ